MSQFLFQFCCANNHVFVLLAIGSRLYAFPLLRAYVVEITFWILNVNAQNIFLNSLVDFFSFFLPWLKTLNCIDFFMLKFISFYQECAFGQLQRRPFESRGLWTEQAHQGSKFSWCLQNDWRDRELWVSYKFLWIKYDPQILTFCTLLGIGIDRYMAPEVFKHRKYDKKVDVFSFAMILYEVSFFLSWNDIKHEVFETSSNAWYSYLEQMLEGEPPFSSYEPYEAAKHVAEGHRPSFRSKSYLPELRE